MTTRWQDVCNKTAVNCQPHYIEIYGPLYFLYISVGSNEVDDVGGGPIVSCCCCCKNRFSKIEKVVDGTDE